MTFSRSLITFALPAIFLLQSCTITASREAIDYRGTQKAPELDIPPDLMRAPGSASAPNKNQPTSALAVTRQNQIDEAQRKIVVPATVAIIREDRGMRYLEIEGKVEALWDKVGEFFRTNGLVIDTLDANTGVLTTKWQENMARAPGSFIREKLTILSGLFSSGQLDRYQAIIEPMESGKVRIYVAHFGLIEEFTPDKTTTQWYYRPSEPLLVLEMLKKMAVFLGVKNAEVIKTGALPAPQRIAVSAQTLIFPSNLTQAKMQLLNALPMGGFNWEKVHTHEIIVRVPHPTISSPIKFPEIEKDYPSYRITFNENGGKTFAQFTALSGNKKPQTPLTTQLQTLADYING